MRDVFKKFPVWQPGDPIQVGDVGTLTGGVFEKQTELSSLFPDLQYHAAEAVLNHPYLYSSQDAIRAALGASASTPGGPGELATVKVTFGRNGGVLFEATGLKRASIEDLYQLRCAIKERRDRWPRGMTLVTAVETSARFRLVISSTSNGTATVSGNVDAVAGLKVADASVSIETESTSGYQTNAGSGALAAALYGFGWLESLQSGFRLMEAEEEPVEAPDFEELAAEDYPEE